MFATCNHAYFYSGMQVLNTLQYFRSLTNSSRKMISRPTYVLQKGSLWSTAVTSIYHQYYCRLNFYHISGHEGPVHVHYLKRYIFETYFPVLIYVLNALLIITIIVRFSFTSFTSVWCLMHVKRRTVFHTFSSRHFPILHFPIPPFGDDA